MFGWIAVQNPLLQMSSGNRTPACLGNSRKEELQQLTGKSPISEQLLNLTVASDQPRLPRAIPEHGPDPSPAAINRVRILGKTANRQVFSVRIPVHALIFNGGHRYPRLTKGVDVDYIQNRDSMSFHDLVVTSFSHSTPWYIPVAYLLVTLGMRWLAVRAFADLDSQIEWPESASFGVRFSILQPKIAITQTSLFSMDLFSTLSNFAMFRICWDLSVSWMVLLLCLSVSVGFFALLVSIREMTEMPDVKLIEVFRYYLLYFPGSSSFLTLLIVAGITYPYSAYVLILLYLLRNRIPKHFVAKLLVRFGICSPASDELNEMTRDAAEALQIEPPMCVIAEVPAVSAFAKSDRDFIAISRPALNILDTAELQQGIVDHEVVHIAQYKRARPINEFFGHYLGFGAILVAATVIAHMSILPSWPVSKTPELIASILVLIIGLMVNLRRLKHRGRFIHGLLSTKEQLKRLHSNSTDNENEADQFARSRVGSEIYGRALKLILESEGEDTEDRHVFGYPAFEQRTGREGPEEDKVLTELDSLQEATVTLSQLFKILLCIFGLFGFGLTIYVTPFFWSPMSCFETFLPRTKALPIVAMTYARLGYTDKARVLLHATDENISIETLLVKLVLEKKNLKKEESLGIRARIVELSDEHLLLGKRAKDIISNLQR